MKQEFASFAMLTLLAGFSHVVSGQNVSTVQGRGSVGINGGPCQFDTLKQAIRAANSGDTIYIQPSTRAELIGKIDIDLTFVPAQAAPPGLTGCEQEMTSATSATVIIDGGGASDDTRGGMAEIRSGANVTFRHMWLRNAVATNGGILAVAGASALTLDNVLVTDGIASGKGGNIYVSSGSGSPSGLRLINNTNVHRGTAVDGGAVALLNSELIIVNGNIGVNSNSGFSTASNNGGGIHAENSTITMSSSQSQIIWNQSGHYGGGLYAVNSMIDINQSVISNNTAITSGGGMYLSDSDMVMRAAIVDSNSATVASSNEGGGALYLSSGSSAEIRTSDFIGNAAESSGGAILARAGTTLQVLENSELVGNTATIGGAISTYGELLIGRSLVEGNAASSLGGGVQCVVCNKVTINDFSTIRANSAKNGGGIHVIGGSSTLVNFRNSTISQNIATGQDSEFGNGGGLYMWNGTLSLLDSQFEQNSAAQNGGGLYAFATTSGALVATLDTVEFTGNITTDSASDQGGGGARFERADQLSIVDSLFDLNHSHRLGGAAMIKNSDNVQISGTTFLANTAYSAGGLFTAFTDLIVDQQSLFEANVAAYRGGGLYVVGSSATGSVSTLLRNVDVYGNRAKYGAGIYLTNDIYELRNVRINNNIAEINGGGIEIGSAIGLITSDVGQLAGFCDPFELPGNRYCTEISNNSAGQFGGGAWLGGGAQFQMLAIADNQALLGGSAIYATAGFGATVSLQNMLVANNGSAIDEVSVIEVINDEELSLDSVTIADNFGSPLVATDSLSSVQLYRSILYGNSIGPLVAVGIPFQRFCNNAQATSGGSQSMGGNLGDPNFTLTARGDYRLPATSVSVDACPNGPSHDLDGLLRPDSSGTYDQGAFEFEGVQGPIDRIFADDFDD